MFVFDFRSAVERNSCLNLRSSCGVYFICTGSIFQRSVFHIMCLYIKLFLIDSIVSTLCHLANFVSYSVSLDINPVCL